MTPITIATSIAPRNFELQRAAIDSWLNLGFKVVSLNSPEESEVIREQFPNISVKSADRNAESITGKPLVFLDDIFASLREENSEVCGIVNSDIHLCAKNDFHEFIRTEASNCFIFGSRIDIESLNNLVGEEYFGGFDFFFFDKSIINKYPKTDFCLGAPWWDFWAPLLPILKGIKVKQLISPFAYHLIHPTNWSHDVFEYYGINFAEHLLAEDINKVAEESIRSTAEKSRENKECVGALALFTLYYLKSKSEKLSYTNLSDCGKTTETKVEKLTQLKEQQSFFQTQFDQLRKKLEEHETTRLEQLRKLYDCQQQLAGLKSSFSWRCTSPLRWITNLLNNKG